MKNQPFILPLSGIILGIAVAEFLPEKFIFVFFGFIFLAVLLSIILSGFHKTFAFSVWVIFILIGTLNFKIQNTHHPLPENLLSEKIWMKLKIKEIYKPSEKFRKYKAEIQTADSLKINREFTLLYWKRDLEDLNPDDEIWVYAKIQENPKPLNPYQFDYAGYLKKQGIFYSVFADSVSCKEKSGNSLAHSIAEFKKEIYAKLIQNHYSKNSADLIGAMLLGDRNEMDREIEDQYRKTGVVHILSISGLHVMMVYGIFMVAFYPLIFLPKGKFIRIFVSLISIWTYVVFVGFQPPVLRSALMISVYYLAVTFHRKPNIYHTLAVCAFILLLINPNFLFDVGFQLSFSAVFFIVWLMPVFLKILKPKRKFAKISVGFVGTSIAAQLGTFPFSAYYFNQTSGLFLAGNVVMIMASNAMIVGGIISIILVCLGCTPKFWVWIFNQFIDLCNGYVEWLSGFDVLIFERISFNILEVILILTGVIFLKFILLKPKFQYVIFLLGLILIFEGSRISRTGKLSKKQEIIVFHQIRNSVIGIRNGTEMDVFLSDLNDSSQIRKFVLNPYEINEKINRTKLYSMKDSVHSYYYKNGNFLFWKNQKIRLLNQNDFGNLSQFDFVIIQNNAKINSSDSVNLIVDGSNYPNHLAKEKNIWHTKKDGAFVLNAEP